MEIEKYKSKPEFIKETANQIIKDFGQSNIFLLINENAEDLYYELFLNLKPELERIVKEDYQRFLNLLYRIDINQKKLKELINPKSRELDIQSLTYMIIDRELLKVITRFIFSQKKIQ